MMAREIELQIKVSPELLERIDEWAKEGHIRYTRAEAAVRLMEGRLDWYDAFRALDA